MANITVPNQYSSGDDTFSDNLVGFQIVDGSSQMTATSFAVDRIIPEKDSKNFQTRPFSDFITLNTLNEEDTEVQSTSSQVVTQSPEQLKFYDAKDDGTKSLYGSLRKRLSVTVQNIILKYPAAIYVDENSPIKSTNYTAESIVYDKKTNTTIFQTQKSLFFNPFDIVIIKPESNIKPDTTNNIRNLYSTFKKYVVEISGETYNVVDYTEPNSDNVIIFEVEGDCFGSVIYDLVAYSNSYLIRPNDGIVEGFYKNLDELEIVLMDRETIPKYQGKFRVPKDINDGESTKLVTQVATWPLTKDDWNIQIVGLDFDSYIEKLSSIGSEVDNYKSNLIVRFLTAPQLFEFDTEDRKAEAIFQLYGQSFDNVKKFIDNIAYMRNVTYDKIKNVPDLLLKNLATTLGLSTVGLFDEDSFQDALYSRTDTQYIGLNLGKNLIETEYEFYRRILVNLAHLYKSKGTRHAIQFFLKFIGAPEPMIKFNEYVYKLDGPLPTSTYEIDIRESIQGTYVSYAATYTGSTIEPENPYGVHTIEDAAEGQPPVMSQYIITPTTGSTTLTRAEYPVDDDTGLPRGTESSNGSIFFQQGAGWYRKTLDHRSHDILDTDNSVLTGRTKVLKTKSKPFTYGEDYFDYYRTLPGLDYGYELTPYIDNNKTEIIVTESESRYTLNRKNVDIFLSADQAIDYDIYTKSRNLLLTFGTLSPPTGITFAEFLTEAISDIITNSNVIRYRKYYQSLDIVYNEYKNHTGFTPYNFIKVNEFIDRMSPYWTQIIDQFVPATTLWMGGNVIENGVLNRSKFWYKQPCVPVEIIENLYPDFCGIFEEDLETIIGGGTIKGVDVAEDYLRELFTFSGFTYVLYIDVNGHLFTGTTEPIIEEVLSGFTPSADCTSLVETTTSVPLICEFKDWVFCDLEAIKIKWLAGIQNLVDNINANSNTTGVSITYEIFLDIDGIWKIRFIILNEECVEGNEIDFYFEPSYDVPRTECDLRVEITTPNDFYVSDIDSCKLNSDIFLTVINDNYDGNGGFVTGIEEQNPEPVNIYVTTGSTCETSEPCYNCDPAYTWTQYDDDQCFRISTTGVTAPTAPLSLEAKGFVNYAQTGTKVFDSGFDVDGTGTILNILTTPHIWKQSYPSTNPLSTVDGPMNNCSLWTTGTTYNPIDTWLGFGVCLSGLTESKTYYVGTGADNQYRIVLDGTTIVDSKLQGVTSTEMFKFWHLYPIEIGAGEHIIEIYGLNQGLGTPAGFGCEVYDNTYEEIVNATTYGDLNVLLTSSGQTQATIVQDLNGNYISSGWTCPSGYTYSPCSGTCIDYIYCDSTAISGETVGICTDCDFDEASFTPIETTTSGCTYLISGASETTIYDIIIGDAANCERKFRIEGLSPHIDEVGSVSGYTVYPKVQYKTTDNFGLKKGTVVYKMVSRVSINSWEDLQTALGNGTVIEKLIEDVGDNEVLISIVPKDPSDISIIDIQNALETNDSFDFTFDYVEVRVQNIECLSSIKKNIVNDEFVVLPTSKLYVYTNINESLEKVPFHFGFKYPEDLYIKSTGTTIDPCCPYPENEDDVTDRLVNQYGFLIDVTSVNLNYCEGGIYYRLDYEIEDGRYSQPPPNEQIIMFNGAETGTTRLIIAHEKLEFECLNMNLQHYFVNTNCSTIPTIEELERNPCGLPDCETIDCNFEAGIESLSECLASTTFIVQYNTTLGPCPGGHVCNCATFYLMGNETNLGTVYLSNTNGSNDIHNYPSGETSGLNRYNEIMMTPEQAEEISASAVDGIVTFALDCALPIGVGECAGRPTGCHEDVTWIKMVRDGVTIFEGCPEGNFISMNPCTGEIE